MVVDKSAHIFRRIAQEQPYLVRKLFRAAELCDQLHYAAVGIGTLISDFVQALRRLMTGEVLSEGVNPVQIQEHRLLIVAKREDPESSRLQYFVEPPDIPLHFFPALIGIGKHISGLETRQCRRSAFDQ